MKAFCDNIQIVFFNININDIGGAFIDHNNAQTTATICEFLCRTGQPPAFFEMRSPTNPNAYRRRETYCNGMGRLGHQPQLIQVAGDGWNFEEIGYREGKRVIGERRPATDTVLCSNDRLAIGLLCAAHESGIRVGHGEEFSLRIAGHDDHPFSLYTCPPLTTVAQDYESISSRSVETLFGLIDNGGGQSRTETHFEGRLVMRASA